MSTPSTLSSRSHKSYELVFATLYVRTLDMYMYLNMPTGPLKCEPTTNQSSHVDKLLNNQLARKTTVAQQQQQPISMAIVDEQQQTTITDYFTDDDDDGLLFAAL